MGQVTSEKSAFLNATGLVSAPPQSIGPEQYASLLENKGPLWVTTDEDITSGFSVHARILIAIKGDGTGDGTQLTFLDPAVGRERRESFSLFVSKLDELARAYSGSESASGLGQVVHFD